MTLISRQPQEEPKVESTEDRVEYYRKLMRMVYDDGLKKILAAPIKSTYSRTFKSWDKTQRDFKMEMSGRLMLINECCKEETGVSLQKEPELPKFDI